MKLHSSIYGWEYVWEEFAQEKGGAVIRDDESRDAAILGLHVPIPNSASVVSVTSENNGTTLVASYRPGSVSVQFRLLPQNPLLKFERALGAICNVPTGDKVFDSRFILQSRDAVVGRLFEDAEFRRLILDEQIAEMKTLKDPAEINPLWQVHPDECAVLLHQSRFITNFEQLQWHYSILVRLVEKLAEHKLVSAPPPVAPASEAETSEEQLVTPSRLHSPILGW